jgi:hypothetical protein
MDHTYRRNIRMRDLEETADLPEQEQPVVLVARCYGLDPDVVRDMDVVEFKVCMDEVMVRNGLNTGD